MISDYGAHHTIVEYRVSSAMHKAVVIPLVVLKLLDIRTQNISSRCSLRRAPTSLERLPGFIIVRKPKSRMQIDTP